MKLVIISDTHCEQPDYLPDGDVLIHCGDFGCLGSLDELRGFNRWFAMFPHRHKILVAGNHDRCFEEVRGLAQSMLNSGITYLEDSGIEIEGVKFWGTPIQPEFCNWAFNRPKGRRDMHYAMIPNDTDILITHCPPYSILDGYLGCSRLLKAIQGVRPALHCFGHIHGKSGVLRGRYGCTFINASLLDENYILTYDAKVVELNKNEITGECIIKVEEWRGK